MKNIQHYKCDNGLQIVTQNIPNVKTVACNWGVPAGVAMNKEDGESVLLTELMQRGACGLSAKEHTDALDALGVQKNLSCGSEYMRLSAVLLGDRFHEALPLLTAYFLSPELPENDLQACKNLCLQAISGLADTPSYVASLALNTHHLPAPFNRSSYGTKECISSATMEQMRNTHKTFCVPNKSILVVTGDIAHEQVVEQVSLAVEHWTGNDPTSPSSLQREGGVHSIEQDSSQVHLAFAIDAPNAAETNSILESVAISIFGGATSGRLFTQVRQRRSLCYSVSASYSPAKQRSAIRMFAGTTPERAQETAEVCLEQLAELTKGITRDEFDRTIQRMKSRTVMHGESTTARAGALWGDQYALGKTRTLDDRLEEIAAVRFEDVNAWLDARVFGDVTCVTVGPETLDIAPESLCIA